MDDSCTQNPRPNIGHADQKHQEIGFDAYGIFGSHVTVLTSFQALSPLPPYVVGRNKKGKQWREPGNEVGQLLQLMQGLILCTVMERGKCSKRCKKTE